MLLFGKAFVRIIPVREGETVGGGGQGGGGEGIHNFIDIENFILQLTLFYVFEYHTDLK